MYRAMAWLGEVLPKDQQNAAAPSAPRTNQDLIEEELFAQRRDLFSSLDMGVLRYHLAVLRRRRRDRWQVRPLERPSSGSEADGCGHGAGPERKSSVHELW